MKKLFLAFAIMFFLSGNMFAQTQTPGLDVLGYGYDVFGNFADQASKKSIVFLPIQISQTLLLGLCSTVFRSMCF